MGSANTFCKDPAWLLGLAWILGSPNSLHEKEKGAIITSLYFGEEKPLGIVSHRNRSQVCIGNQCYSSSVDQTHERGSNDG